MSNPHITDKPDDKKSINELKRENEYLKAENACLKNLDIWLREKSTMQTKQRSSI